MKRIIITFGFAVLLVVSSFAQKYAFVDTDYILNNIPSYKAAQGELDELSQQYEGEINVMYEEIEKLYREYQAEKVLLTDEMRGKREEQIVAKEREAKKLQNDYFGQEGLLYKKREELITPIQEEVYIAVKEIANESGYAAIFDTASGPSLIYTNPRYDISDEVLQRLGYKN